jgi:hypothetical protein
MTNNIIPYYFPIGETLTSRDYNTIEAALGAKLATLDVGAVYPGWIREADDHAIVYRRTSGGRAYFMDGGTSEVMPTFAIDIWGTSVTEVKTKAKIIRQAISGFTGYWGNKRVDHCHLDNSRELHEKPKTLSDSWVYRIMQDYTITTFEECNEPLFLDQLKADSIDQSLFEYLNLNLLNQPVKPWKLPQGQDYPCCLIREVAYENEDDLDDDGDASKTVYAFDVYARSYTEAKHLAIDIRLLIDGLTGSIGTTNVLNIENQTEYDTVVVDATGKPYFLVSCEYKICFNTESYDPDTEE